MKRQKFFLVLLALIIGMLGVSPVWAQTAEASDPSPLKFPTPKGIANQLFYLQRDPNTNTIIYALNVDKNGVLDKKEPVIAFWIRYGENGKRQDLNYIQRKFAYGVQCKAMEGESYEIRFVSHKKLPLYLIRSAEDKQYHVYITVNEKRMRLDRIFLRIEGGSFWLPNVKYVELKGLSPESNTPIVERIKV